MITRILDPAEITLIKDFYQKYQYDQPISPDDHFLVIQNEGGIIGALRVCHEEGVFILRGMRVADAFQRQGVGSHLLDYFSEFIDNKGCYCIAKTYLQSFYERVGFEEIKQGEAPDFLKARLHHYQTKLGLDVRLLYKPATGNHVAL